MSDKSIGQNSVRSSYKTPDTNETSDTSPGAPVNETEEGPRLQSGSRDISKSFWFTPPEQLHVSFQEELLYSLDSRSPKKVFRALAAAVEDQNYEGLAGLADELDKSPLSEELQYIFDIAMTMRQGGIGDNVLEMASFIAGGHDSRDRCMTKSDEIIALKIEEVCQRLSAKKR